MLVPGDPIVYTNSITLQPHYYAIFEALTGVGGGRAFISGEQRQILRGMGTKTILGNREHKKTIFHFWGTGEQANLFRESKGTGTPPPPSSVRVSSFGCIEIDIAINVTVIKTIEL